MYCIKCGVELADTEKSCPLCKTVVCHPDFTETAEGEYPEKQLPDKKKQSRVSCFIVSAFFLMALFIIPLCDMQFDSTVDWAGFATGAILLLYEIVILPFWFKKPNPVIFVPCGFAAVAAYVGYVCFATAGNWFFTFALPIIAGFCLIVTTVVTLTRYIKRGVGWLFVFGGAGVALGGFMLVIELLLNLTFSATKFVAWSIYPLICLVLIGGLLIFLGIYRPARELMEQKFFF
jgi:hypothetical protein